MENLKLPQSPKIEIVKINERDYSLSHKPKGVSIGEDTYHFVVEQWNKPQGYSPRNMYKALSLRDLYSLKDEKGEFIAMCSYSINRNIDSRFIIGDGQIALTLVKEEYRTRSGIGSFLTKMAIDKIVESTKKMDGFVPPVVIQAQAATPEGSMLLKSMQEEYKESVRFEIEEIYKSK